MLETNYLLTILVEVSPFVGTNLDKAVGYGLTWVTIIVTAVGPGTLDLAIIIVEIIVITINDLSTFNQLTIAIDIVPLVVFRHKAWTGNFTTIAIKEVTLVIDSDKVSFNLTAFIVKVILLTVNSLKACHGITVAIEVIPSLVLRILRKSVDCEISCVWNEVTCATVRKADELVFSLNTSLFIEIEGCAIHVVETTIHLTVAIKIANILARTCKVVESVKGLNPFRIVVIDVTITALAKDMT